MYFYVTCSFILILHHQCTAQDQQSEKIKENSVSEMLEKINKIAVQSLSKADYNGKLEILRKVEEKLSKAAKSLGEKGERYIKLIMKGIKAKAFAEVTGKKETDIQKETLADIKLNDNSSRFEEEDVQNDKSITETEIKLNDDTEHNFEKTLERRTINHTEEQETFSNENNVIYELANDKVHTDTSTEHSIQSLTYRYDCESGIDRICKDIKQMKQLKCHFGYSEVPIVKLCDGVIDCPDRTDEKFCTSQVTERVHNANDVISKAEESFALGCFPNITEKTFMTTQIITFRSILQAQEEFVEKYRYLNWSLIMTNNDYLKGEGSVKKTVNELSLIIRALALALDNALCSQHVNTETVNTLTARKFSDMLNDDLDELINDAVWSPKYCVCERGRCKNITCSDTCKQVCWQKYGLTRWACESINKTEHVPMSTICDGKFDCLDQSDEKGCITGTSFAKFEAHDIFKQILLTLSAKINSKEYALVRSRLLSLQKSIESLQKFSMDTKPDIEIISRLRKKCFSSLGSIYSEILSKASNLYETEEAYIFLLSINENIVNALKRSNTGNNRIIANDGCFCRKGQCSMPVCSRKCIRSCIAEPILTNYYCEGSNKSITLDQVCNQEINCPQEDDESQCQKEICRRHHLSLLRRSLQAVGKNREGTSMGELLENWKTKASSILIVAETNERPTPMVIRDIVNDILNDLVITYGILEDYRRDNEYALEEFTVIARNIMKTLRSCSY